MRHRRTEIIALAYPTDEGYQVGVTHEDTVLAGERSCTARQNVGHTARWLAADLLNKPVTAIKLMRVDYLDKPGS